MPTDTKIRLVADAEIPYVNQLFSGVAEIQQVPSSDISRSLLMESESLLVRSVTRVNRSLIEGTPVRFVGSATSGADHISQDDLAAMRVFFAHAPGSNAPSVVDHVVTALLELCVREGIALDELTIGVVGCGNIGGRLISRLERLGCTTLWNDPPRHQARLAQDQPSRFSTLTDLLTLSDVVSLHVPLTFDGPFPTERLIGRRQLKIMPPGAWLINTSRGGTVDEEQLLHHLDIGRVAHAVIDVWEGEPDPNTKLIEAASIATPHIAGYAREGKWRAAFMLAQTFHRWLETDFKEPESPTAGLRLPTVPRKTNKTEWLHKVSQSMYPISRDDRNFRKLLPMASPDRSVQFAALRASYPERHEFGSYHVDASTVSAEEFRLLTGLGISAS